jgi:putative membrane protein
MEEEERHQTVMRLMARKFRFKKNLFTLKIKLMKNYAGALLIALVGLFSCNNSDTNDTTVTTDSTNSMNGTNGTTGTTGTNQGTMDTSSNRQNTTADQATSTFLMSAANGGLAEVEMAKMAQQKGSSDRVKDLGAMLFRDHSAANDMVKSLASSRSVTLPAQPSADKQKDVDNLNQKSGTAFDKAFLDVMRKNHEAGITMFQNASRDVKDSDVKSFAEKTLPTLRMHLDSVKNLQKTLKY